jgi:hypothetical protein
VRGHILVATAVVTAGWLAACSKPASQAGKSADRRLQLVESPKAPTAVVSDLEAGRPHTALAGSARKQAPKPVETLTERQPIAGPALVPLLSATSNSLAAPTLDLAPVPAAPEPAAPVVAEDPMSTGGYHGHHAVAQTPMGAGVGGGMGRGPTIIIRGGMGGPDDDCDLRRGHGLGAAVNRLAPPLGGGFPRGIR